MGDWVLFIVFIALIFATAVSIAGDLMLYWQKRRERVGTIVLEYDEDGSGPNMYLVLEDEPETLKQGQLLTMMTVVRGSPSRKG